MIILLINWVFITITCLAWGQMGLSLLEKMPGAVKNAPLHPVILAMLGMALLTAAGNLISLCFPINAWVSAAAGGIAIGYGLFTLSGVKSYCRFWWRQLEETPKFCYFLALLVFLIAVFKAAGPTEIPDEGEYFLPLVRWIEQYPAVPGTALVHDRLGYNSAFHLSSAIFGQAGLFPGGLYDLNAWVFLLVFIYFLSGISRLIRSNYRFFLADLLMLSAGVFLFRKLLTSMDADLPANFIGLLVLLLWLQKVSEDKVSWDSRSMVMLILAVFLATVKFTAVFLLLFPAWLLLETLLERKTKPLTGAVLTGLLLSVPWFIRNYYISGYLVYPVYQVDLFNPEWKVPLEIAKANYQYVAEHAKTLVVRYSYGYSGTGPLAFESWWPQWLMITQKDLVGKVVLYGSPPALLGNIMLLWKGRQKGLPTPKYLRVTFFIVLAFLLFWFFRFPAIRFAWPWLLTFLVLGMAGWVLVVFKIPKNWLVMILLLLTTLSLLRGSWKSIREVRPLSHYLLRPAPVQELRDYRVKDLGGVSLIVADSVYCWGADPPCMPFYYQEEIELRTGNIEDGFRLKLTFFDKFRGRAKMNSKSD